MLPTVSTAVIARWAGTLTCTTVSCRWYFGLKAKNDAASSTFRPGTLHVTLLTPLVSNVLVANTSQSALLIKEYLPTTATSKLVDFCVYLNPEAEADATEAHDYAEAIRQLQLNLPMRSINHTSYLPVASRPISLSLETKRTGKDSDEATLQIGTWHLAQWRMLRGLLTRTGGADHAQAALSELGVLPAIIVQGHKWSFAATTLEGTKTVCHHSHLPP